MPLDDDDLPTAPSEIPNDITSRIQAQSPDRLRVIARYAETLAAAKEKQLEEADTENEDDDVEIPDEPDEDLPNDVPRRATKTTKTINGNDYWYWQWREGDKIKSEYIKPVNPDN